MPREAGRRPRRAVPEEGERRAPDRRRRAVLGDTGSLSDTRRYEPASPMRSRKRRYRWGSRARCAGRCRAAGRIAVTLGQRLHGAAERRPHLVERDHVALVGELERGSETGEPASDDSCVQVGATLRRRCGASCAARARRLVEDVVATLLDRVESRRVEVREGATHAALRRSSREAASAPPRGVPSPAAPGGPSARPTPRSTARPRCPPRTRRTRPARPAAGTRARASSPRPRRG